MAAGCSQQGTIRIKQADRAPGPVTRKPVQEIMRRDRWS